MNIVLIVVSIILGIIGLVMFIDGIRSYNLLNKLSDYNHSHDFTEDQYVTIHNMFYEAEGWFRCKIYKEILSYMKEHGEERLW